MNFTGLSIIQNPTLAIFCDWRTLALGEESRGASDALSIHTVLVKSYLLEKSADWLLLLGWLGAILAMCWYLGEGDFTASRDLWAEASSRGPGLAPDWADWGQWTDDVLGGSQSRLLSFLLFILCPMINDDYVIPERMKIIDITDFIITGDSIGKQGDEDIWLLTSPSPKSEIQVQIQS